MLLHEAPRDRLEQLGAPSLSSVELLALVIQQGPAGEAMEIAEEVLISRGSLEGIARTNLFELMMTRGIGPARASRILAAIELGKRLTSVSVGTRPQISSPADAARVLVPEMSTLEQEHLRVLLLDTRNRVLGVHEVYKGSLNTTMIRVGEVFREAIRRNCAGIIIAHNHPSGQADPSVEDVRFTTKVVEAGELLDIPLLDHLVIGHGHFVSLKERGLGFKA
jgi:DNA repair protein RadC